MRLNFKQILMKIRGFFFFKFWICFRDNLFKNVTERNSGKNQGSKDKTHKFWKKTNNAHI